MRPITAARLATLLLLGSSACGDNQLAFGDFNSIIVATRPGTWEAVQDSVFTALEPHISTTVAREEVFTVTFQDPERPEWGNLRKFRQILLFGTADDPWMAAALARRPRGAGPPEGVFQVTDVWVRNQIVTAVVLGEGDDAHAILDNLSELRDIYLTMYRQRAISRMFLSGRDSALADTLRLAAGFSLLLPEVYYWDRMDSVFLFRNDNPHPSELIRQFMVTWRTPIPETMELDSLLAWRNALAGSYYNEPQVVDLGLAQEQSFEHRGTPAFRFQATWQNAPGAAWPAAGPLIVQTVECPAQDRLYLLDAWLYAPGKDKFEYMIQLETILDSFRCGT
jgi:hypothetical protein